MQTVALSHFSAATYYGVPFLQTFFEKSGTVCYTVFRRRDRFRKEGVRVHLCSVDLPSDAVTYVRGTRIVSPEYMFVQCCASLGIIKAILLGCLLCMPFPDGRPPLTTIARLKKFARAASNVRGRPRALDALRYIRENFCYPMEIMRYLMLDLPNHLGGCGLGGDPLINAKLPITPEEAARLDQYQYYVLPDAYYPAQKLIQEYYGQDVHGSAKAVRHDAIRENILREKGFTVVTINKDNLYKLKNFAVLHRQIAEFFGKRIRINSRTYRERFTEIYELLPRLVSSTLDNAQSDYLERRTDLSDYFLTMKVRERVR